MISKTCSFTPLAMLEEETPFAIDKDLSPSCDKLACYLEGAWICCLCKNRSSRRRWHDRNEKKCINLKFVCGFSGAIKNETTGQYETTLQSFNCTQHKEIFFYHYLTMFKGPNLFSKAIYT